MKTEEKKRVSDALSEEGHKIKVGALTFRLKPLTLAQIYEMGAVANDIDAKDLQEKERIRVIAELIAHHEDAKAMIDVFIICLFRKKWKRWLYRSYITHRLTAPIFQEAMNSITQSFDANFFLTSIIFLSQTVAITEPSPTTVHGQWSEE